MAKFSIPSILLLSFTAILFSGCPDYSHQRQVPDYENMVDSGVEDGNEGAVK